MDTTNYQGSSKAEASDSFSPCNPEKVSALLKPESSWTQDFVQTAVYAGLQNPITGTTQLIDKCIGSNLARQTQFMKEPVQADPFSLRWHVQTLASVGKSTVLNLLRAEGFPVMEEIAGRVISEGEFHPLKNREAFQRKVMTEQIASERSLDGLGGIRFLDRGLLDGVAYYAVEGHSVPPYFDKLPHGRYSLVLLLEELPFYENNGVRFENISFTRRITPHFATVYGDRGLTVVPVPATKYPQQRVNNILDIVHRHIKIHGVNTER